MLPHTQTIVASAAPQLRASFMSTLGKPCFDMIFPVGRLTEQTENLNGRARLLRWVWLIGGLLAGSVVTFLLVSVGVVDRLDGIPGTQEDPILSLPTYLSFLSVMLTAVTVVLAALAILIGIVAAYTFKELTERAEAAAKTAAGDALSDEKIAARIEEVALRQTGTKMSTDELEQSFDPTDNQER